MLTLILARKPIPTRAELYARTIKSIVKCRLCNRQAVGPNFCIRCGGVL